MLRPLEPGEADRLLRYLCAVGILDELDRRNDHVPQIEIGINGEITYHYGRVE